MKISKKIGLGLFFALLGLTVLAVSPAHKALAAGGPINGTGEWRQATYTMNQNTTIVVNLAGNDHDNINFTDSTPNSGTHTYVADTNGTGVCSGSITFNSGQTFNNKPVAASISVKFADGTSPIPSCVNGGASYSNNSISIINNTTGGGGTPADTGPATITYGGATYHQIGATRAYGLSATIGTDCYGGQILVLDKLDSAANAPVTGTVLDVIAGSAGTELSTQVTSFPAINLTVAPGTRCLYNENQDQGNNAQIKVTAAGAATFTQCSKGGTTCGGAPGSSGDPPGSTSSGPPTCESSSFTSFEWLICPVLSIFDSMTNTLNGILESLLNFDVSSNLTPQVKSSWNIMKNISSAVLVIVLLIAVISQAMGGGPVDAYTLRKILPRLVIAVILIQVSWIMLIFVINIANDLGHGVRDIISAPFGGWQNLDLEHLIAPLGAGGAITITALFTTMVVAGIFSGLTIAGVGLLGLTAVLSLLVAFVVLILRQVFIILLVIMFPIAMIAWILPGTQRYWKLWSDNFIKLMLLFPLIMAIIYAGRIFAHIAIGSAGTGTILAVLILFIGFFAPYWFLPRVFRWGGQMYGALGTGVMNATKTARSFPGRYATGVAKENRQFKAAERARRISRDPTSASRWDRLMAGRYNVARGGNFLGGGDARINKYANTVAEGQKAAREAVSQELLAKGYQNWTHPQKLNANEKWLRGESAEGIDASDNEELRLFAFKTLADLGDQDRIRKARQQGKLKGSTWLKGRAENISSLNQQASDMGIQNDLSTVSADAMTNWKGHTFKEWIRQLDNGVVMDNSDMGGGDLDVTKELDSNGNVVAVHPERRTEQMVRGKAQAQRIMNNRLIFDRLSSDQQDFVRRIATDQGTQVVTSDAGVKVPTGVVMASNRTARESVISGLASDNARAGSPGRLIAADLAPRVIEAARAQATNTPLNPEQTGNLQLFQQVRDRARQADATPQMQAAYKNMEDRISEALSDHEAQTEQRLTAANSTNIPQALANEKQRSQLVKTTLGLPEENPPAS